MKDFFIYLLIMAGSTYLIRALPFALFSKKIKSTFVRSFLYYIPYTVLTAMTFPAALYATGSVLSAAVGLGVAILVIQNDFDLLTGVVYAFATAIGFALAMVLFAGIREQLSLVDVPKGMDGMAIALVTAGLLAMAFMGFSGVDKGLAALFGV